MNFLKKYWERFKGKSIWGKSSDVFFLVFLIMMLTSDGRIFFQRMVLSTGFFGSYKASEPVPLSIDELHWQLIDDQGKEVRFSSFIGKPVFLNFWATWCPPCNAEMPGIIDLKNELGDQANFVFVTTESPEKVMAHLAANGWDIPVYFYQYIPSEALSSEALPTTIIINAKGEMVHKSKGMRQWNTNSARELLLGQ
ncbi:MAG: TlpA family protein disulfide reductase [Salibacteraceae bacterium]|jgi:thiol-disulfide isomerase/thioredoxin|nr:TlpA family protein disulfide reductase [Salibacteraceae bacterium]MDP4685473.1 TlpA family protein disulfide reductase [Salibacteraceae bacterium]MDP4764401.1 TlpA family protein disulfide reductase [Salibacteraceae bacterium]MDP4842856.1 TlpA family protein disulfide reductase [Salibacteraceae bacterium]MDP4935341.1 TlpA family protein disulfide reductase [Salibacteraceae bacterium]